MEKNEHSQPPYSDKQLTIIRSAEELIAKHGYDGTSVRDIAQHAGVNVAMISYYFGSKEHLLEAIIANRIASSGLMMEDLLKNTELSPIEKMKAIVDKYVDRMMEQPFYHNIIMRQQLAGRSVDINSSITHEKLRNLQIIKSIIAEGVRKKVFTKQADIPLLNSTLFGVYYQVINNQAFYKHVWNMEALGEEAFQIQLCKKLKTHLKHIVISALTSHEA